MVTLNLTMIGVYHCLKLSPVSPEHSKGALHFLLGKFCFFIAIFNSPCQVNKQRNRICPQSGIFLKFIITDLRNLNNHTKITKMRIASHCDRIHRETAGEKPTHSCYSDEIGLKFSLLFEKLGVGI
jgi:hypothetical protein